MNLPLKYRVFVDSPQTLFTAVPGSAAAFEKIYGSIDPGHVASFFKKDGKKVIDTILTSIMPTEFWMITTVKRDDGASFMLYVLNKDEVLTNIGFDNIMEFFS